MKKIIAFANSERLPQDMGGSLPSNVIHLANEERFTQTHFSEPLTTFALGFRDPSNIEAELDFLAPPVQVGRRFEFKKANNAEEFYSEADDIRGIGADFKVVEYKGTSVNEKTLNKGLTVVLDHDQNADLEAAVMSQTSRLLRRLLRNDYRRAIAAAAAAATNTALTWDTTDGKNPDADLTARLIAAADKSGVSPNRVLFGSTAWQLRFASLDAQTAPGKSNRASYTPEQLAALLGLDKIVVSKARYTNAATTKAQIVGSLFLAFYAEEGTTTEDPSNLKRFFSLCEGGQKYRVYREERTKKTVVSVEHYSNVVLTSPTGLEKGTIS